MVPADRINRRLCVKDKSTSNSFGKNRTKVLKLKMPAPNQEIYLAMSYFLKSSTPGSNPPAIQTTNYAVAAQQVKSVSFAPDTQNNIPGWAQNLENKLSD